MGLPYDFTAGRRAKAPAITIIDPHRRTWPMALP